MLGLLGPQGIELRGDHRTQRIEGVGIAAFHCRRPSPDRLCLGRRYRLPVGAVERRPVQLVEVIPQGSRIFVPWADGGVQFLGRRLHVLRILGVLVVPTAIRLPIALEASTLVEMEKHPSEFVW